MNKEEKYLVIDMDSIPEGAELKTWLMMKDKGMIFFDSGRRLTTHIPYSIPKEHISESMVVLDVSTEEGKEKFEKIMKIYKEE